MAEKIEKYLTETDEKYGKLANELLILTKSRQIVWNSSGGAGLFQYSIELHGEVIEIRYECIRSFNETVDLHIFPKGGSYYSGKIHLTQGLKGRLWYDIIALVHVIDSYHREPKASDAIPVIDRLLESINKSKQLIS